MGEPATNSKDWSSMIMEIESNKSRWNLSSDLKLLEVLKTTTGDLVDQIYSKISTFDDLSCQTNVTTNKLNNLITSMLIMTNSKFIENRVYEEDIKEITSSTVESTETIKHHQRVNGEFDGQEVVERLKRSIDTALNGLRRKYHIESEDLGEANKYNLLHRLYSVRNEHTHRPLPYLIGSNDFLRDTFVGLKVDEDEDDNPVIVLNPSGAQSTADEEIKVSNHHLHSSSESLFASDRNPVPNPTSSSSIRDNSIARNSNLFGDGAGENSEDEEDDFFNEAKIAKPSFNLHADEEEEDFGQTSGVMTSSNLANNVMNTRLDSQMFDEQDDSDDDLFASKLPSTTGMKSVITNMSPNQGDTGSIGSTLDSKSSSSKEIPTPKLTNVARHFDSIFGSDSEEVDIFNTKLPSKVGAAPVSVTKKNIAVKPQKSHLFSSSSDDDDDDLFSRIRGSSSRDNVKKESSLAATTTSTITTATKSTTSEVTKKPFNAVPTAAVPHMSSMISELSSVIKQKSKVLPSSSSTSSLESLDQETSTKIHPSPKATNMNSSSSSESPPLVGQSESTEQSPSQWVSNGITADPLSTDSPSTSNLPDLQTTSSDTSEFNSILKHKARLNAGRQRRPPTKLKSLVDTQNSYNSNSFDQSDLVKSDHGKDDDDDDQTKESVKEEAPFEMPVPNDTTATVTSPPSLKTTRNMFSSSDDSDSDLFLSRTTPKPRSAAVTTNHQVSAEKSVVVESENRSTVDSKPAAAKSNVVKSVSLFSDDSDDDIFKKPTLGGTSNKSTEVKEPPKKVSLFFDDSDDEDNDTFVAGKSTAVPFTRAPTTVNTSTSTTSPSTSHSKAKPSSGKVPPVKKSIFDDDSDDDLFKF